MTVVHGTLTHPLWFLRATGSIWLSSSGPTLACLFSTPNPQDSVKVPSSPLLVFAYAIASSWNTPSIFLLPTDYSSLGLTPQGSFCGLPESGWDVPLTCPHNTHFKLLSLDFLIACLYLSLDNKPIKSGPILVLCRDHSVGHRVGAP